MIRYYVLTSRNLKCLKRHFASLPRTETTVVINTTLDWYRDDAMNWCKKNKIDYVVTESNGYPGRGKNSLLDHFLNSKYEYMVQIDGDDFMQPHGVNLYRAVAQSDNPPDGVQIVHGLTWHGGRKHMDELFLRNPWNESYRNKIPSIAKQFPHLRPKLMDIYHNAEKYRKLHLKHRRHNEKWNYPLDVNDEMECPRLIFWSRKLASLVRFREDLMIGEDTLVNMQIRDKAYKGEIKLQKVVDKDHISYVYDLTNSGIVKRLQNTFDWTWVEPLVNAVEEESKNWTVPFHYSLDPVEIEIEKAEEIKLSKI